MSKQSPNDEWTDAWVQRYGAQESEPKRRPRRLRRTRGNARWVLIGGLVLAIGVPSFAIAAGAITGSSATFVGTGARYTELVRNQTNGKGGAAADTCTSNAGNQACLNMVNSGTGYAASFRTRGLSGFLLQTSGAGTATPFVLDSNATGKVNFLNADQLDGLDSTAFQATTQAASVSAPGVALSSRGASAVSHTGDGTYSVTFSTDISKCYYTATETTSTDAGAAAVTPLSATVLQVVTRKGGGSDGTGPTDRADRPFHVVVNC